MGSVITYRHNIMNIGSLDTFFSIRGGCNNNLRDVYFIRALGECDRYAEKILEIDKRMDAEAFKRRLHYVRISSFPVLNYEDGLSEFVKAYDERGNGAIHMPGWENIELLCVIANALDKTIQIYADVKKNISMSMQRNFAVKLLFRLDKMMKQYLVDWSEKACIKVVIENVVKEQDYLFAYFLTLLGCDVLLLQNVSDIDLIPELEKLSKSIKLGSYGTAKLASYSLYVPEKAEKKDEKTIDRIKAADKYKVTTVSEEPKSVKNENAAKEKSFEQLAQMASSIVMIAVHDRDSEVMGTGSGIMIGEAGYILTNFHVIAGGSFFSIRIEDDETIYATDEVIKYNSVLDLAVIRINRRLRPLPIYGGRRKLVRGQKVVAIGSPLGMFNSVSDGIISGFRTIQDRDMIQFTAPISPGSSGGAVLNMYGEVIGISTAGLDSGQNINLAVGYESILFFTNGFTG